jgi:hypothetical protein
MRAGTVDCHLCEGANAVHETIVQAIHERRRLRLRYNGTVRIVEPQCHGLGTRGTELLRVRQVSGGSYPEALFDVAKIADLVVLDSASSARDLTTARTTRR